MILPKKVWSLPICHLWQGNNTPRASLRLAVMPDDPLANFMPLGSVVMVGPKTALLD